MRFALLWLFALSPFASAELYKCSDTSGAVTYQATPCVDMNEEVMRIQKTPKKVPDEKDSSDAATTDDIVGKRSSASSPLPRAYQRFIRSLTACKRETVLKVVSAASRREMTQISLKDFKEQCKIMRSFARSDFSNAVEQFETGTAKLVWQESEEHRDAAGRMRSSMTTTVNFVREDGTWMFGK